MDEENNITEGNDILPETGDSDSDVSLNKEQEGEEVSLQNEESRGISLQKEEGEEPTFGVVEEVLSAEAAPVFDGSSAPALEAAPKKSNRNLIAGVVILVIIAAVGIVAGPALMANPLTKVLTAFSKTFAEAGATASPMEQASGMGAALKTVNDGKTSIKGQLSLVEAPLSMDASGDYAGIGIGYELDTDMQGKMFYFDMGLMMDAAKLLNVEFYGNADTLDFAVPALVNGYFRVPLTNLGKAYKDSIFYEYQPMEVDDDYSLSFFDETKVETVNKNYTAVGLKHGEWLKRLQKDVTVEKTDEADMQVGEEMALCQGYLISMTDEKAHAFLQEYISYWQTDVDAQALLDEIIKASAARNSYNSYMTQMETEEEMQRVMDELLVEAKKIELSNISLNCYIDKNNIIRKLLYAGDFTNSGETINMIFDSQLAGAGRAMDDVNMALHLSVQDEVVSMKFQNRQYQEADNVITEGTFLMGDQFADELDGQWNMTYNTKDGQLSFDADLGVSESDAIAFYSKGVLEIPEKGKSFHLNMDSIDLSLTDNSGTEHILLKGLFSLDQLTEAVKQPTGTEYKLLELDEAGLQAIIFEVYGNVMRLGNELSGILN